MEKTVIKQLINSIKEIEENGNSLTTKGILLVLENSLYQEREQIINAFEEGVKYGNSELQTFDYPAARYYSGTYEK